MKKILSLITALLLIFSLSACGGNKDTEETAVETEIATEESTDVATEAASEEKSENTSKEASADEKNEKKETKEESASKEDAKEGEEAPDKNETPQIETEVITPSENKNDNRPTVYWATSEDKDTSDVSYHKKDCAIIKDKEPAELAWEIIDALGMPACEKCKPN